MPQKARTSCSLDKDSVCPFRFSIRVDSIGFYLVGGTGCAYHADHPKLTNIEYAVPTRLIGIAKKDIAPRQMMGLVGTYIFLDVALSYHEVESDVSMALRFQQTATMSMTCTYSTK